MRRRRDLSLVVKGLLFALVRVAAPEKLLERALLDALRNNFGGPRSARAIEEAGALAFVTPLVSSEEGLWCESSEDCRRGVDAWTRSARGCIVARAFAAWLRTARRKREHDPAHPSKRPSWWVTRTAGELEGLLAAYEAAFGADALDVLVQLLLDEAGQQVPAAA